VIAAVSAGVTYPNGFRASGIAAGMKPSGRRDLALLLGDPGTTAAGTFTSNAVVAAPIVLSQKHLASGGGRGVLVNSGQANAATGSRGDADAETAVSAAAAILGIPPNELLQCSTGVIGEPLHMDALLGGLPALAAAARVDGGADFARAIMTTDTVAKSATTDAGPYRVGGAAKGVGMISPSLATMLAFVTTDAPVSAGDLQTAASTVLAPVFNAITVDGCTSTNDTVLVFASGAASSGRIAPGGAAWNAWADAIETVGASLASQLIHDGEGVTHVMLVDVTGAADEADARRLANAVGDSPLVKTALFGADPNPGRILQALGAAGAALNPGRVDVWVGDTRLVHAGVIPPAYFAADELRIAAAAAMAEPEVGVRIVVGDGPGTARVLGGDLSYDYVRINGEYTT
jgi:glutamate N-acetyltransferase/amino-acid N-acetyltransferase